MFILFAHAENETSRYNAAQAQQLANATGMSIQDARRQIRANANGNAPFSTPGRRSNPVNVRNRMNRAAAALRRR